MSYKEDIEKLNTKIAEYEAQNITPKHLYIEQLKLLEKAHNKFIEDAKQANLDLSSNLNIMEIEIKQLSAMKQLAKKIGAPTSEYDNQIKEIRTRVLGKEITDTYFK